MSAHEHDRHEESPLPSNRSFGLVFTVVFLIVGLLPLFSRHTVRWWALAVSGVFLILALLQSPVLTPLNRLWMRFGLFLHKIISPVILGIIYFLVITPIGWWMLRKGKDPMRRSFDPAAQSYWIPRDPPGPPPASMSNQF